MFHSVTMVPRHNAHRGTLSVLGQHGAPTTVLRCEIRRSVCGCALCGLHVLLWFPQSYYVQRCMRVAGGRDIARNTANRRQHFDSGAFALRSGQNWCGWKPFAGNITFAHLAWRCALRYPPHISCCRMCCSMSCVLRGGDGAKAIPHTGKLANRIINCAMLRHVMHVFSRGVYIHSQHPTEHGVQLARCAMAAVQW